MASRVEFVPIHTSLSTIRGMTVKQDAAIVRLLESWEGANSISLLRSSFGLPERYIGFVLRAGVGHDSEPLLVGGIDPEGSIST